MTTTVLIAIAVLGWGTCVFFAWALVHGGTRRPTPTPPPREDDR